MNAISNFIPKRMFFTNGVGCYENQQLGFEPALRDADIEICSLVMVTTIFAPGCRIISRKQGINELKPGHITFVVLARECTNEPNYLVSTAIGLARPTISEHYG
jgi:arginine decarboxylase